MVNVKSVETGLNYLVAFRMSKRVDVKNVRFFSMVSLRGVICK